MTEFRTGQSANAAHRALKSSLQIMEKARQCAVLWFGEILDRRLYEELGYSSINQYAKVELEFSKSRTGDFLQLCTKLKKLPLVKEQVASGRLGYTAARVLVTVADATNEAAWVDVALGRSRRELERQVKAAKIEATGQTSLLPVAESMPAAVVPVQVSLEMSPTQFARYGELWQKLRKGGDLPGDKIEALLEIMAAHTTESSPRGDLKPPVQIHVHQCPDCEKATVQTSKGELEISKNELEHAQCDCQTARPGERNTTAIPPATRRQVLARYRHKCQSPGCDHTGYLEIHHIVPRAQGGTNDPANLTCLCSACHRLVHQQRGLFVKSPAPAYRIRPRLKADS